MTAAAAPTVSVIVPTHNRAGLLALTLHSALSQQGIDLEVLVIDDASTHDLRDHVRELADPRVRLIRHDRPQGPSVARNRGVAEAAGHWIAFLDDDDLWAPDKLSLQVRTAEREGRGWVYAGSVNVSEDLRLLGGAPPAEPADVVAAIARANLIPGGCSGVVVRRHLLPPTPFDPALRILTDWDLWIRLSRLDRPAAVMLPLVGYRIHAGNLSRGIARMFAELDIIEERYGGPVDRTRFHRHVARVSLRASRFGAALRYYCQAAVADPTYRGSDFVPDALEVAQEATRGFRDRLTRALTGAPTTSRSRSKPRRRYAAHQPWVEQARPWLDELGTYRSGAVRSSQGD